MVVKSSARVSKKRTSVTPFAEMLALKFPDLKKKLLLGGITKTPIEFLEQVMTGSFFISITLLVLSYLFLFEGISLALQSNILMFFVYLVLPPFLVLPVVFGYFMLYPDALIMKRKRELDYETLFAGRQLVISLRSGMPLFESLVGATKGYGSVSVEIAAIVDKVVLGTPMTQAIRETVQYNPSKYFTRIMMQISNSINSGSNIGEALEIVLSQISKEQMIALKEYSQKLTPIVMFYMIFGIIVPTLGVVLATVVFSSLGASTAGNMSSAVLLPVFIMITIIQFLFLGMLESSRPKYIL